MKLKFFKQRISPNKRNFYLNILLLIGFIAIMEPELTGIANHEWFSLLLGAAMVLHILWHWKWIAALTKKFFDNLFHQTRAKYILSIILVVSFAIVFWSGLMESVRMLPFFGLSASNNPFWEWLHSAASDLMWGIVGVHLILDWKWIVNAFRRYIFHLPYQGQRKRNKSA